MKKMFLIVLSIFLLCGCEIKSEQRTNEENVQACLTSGGSAHVQYCKHSDTICIVECLYDKED